MISGAVKLARIGITAFFRPFVLQGYFLGAVIAGRIQGFQLFGLFPLGAVVEKSRGLAQDVRVGVLYGVRQFVRDGARRACRGNFDIAKILERAGGGILQDVDAQGRRQLGRCHDRAGKVQALLHVGR